MRIVALVYSIICIVILTGVAQAEQVSNKLCKVGSTVSFGCYEQDNNTDNGKEMIEWVVIDVEGKKSLLLSKYVLDCQPFHDTEAFPEWKKSQIRSWLNNTFYRQAFDTEEQKAILKSTIETTSYKVIEKGIKKKYAGDVSTKDCVFLLSGKEVDEYLDYDKYDLRRCIPTDYAQKQGAHLFSTKYSKCDYCFWWLRSPNGGLIANTPTYISEGEIHSIGNSTMEYGIRPAIWVKHNN